MNQKYHGSFFWYKKQGEFVWAAKAKCFWNEIHETRCVSSCLWSRIFLSHEGRWVSLGYKNINLNKIYNSWFVNQKSHGSFFWYKKQDEFVCVFEARCLWDRIHETRWVSLWFWNMIFWNKKSKFKRLILKES